MYIYRKIILIAVLLSPLLFSSSATASFLVLNENGTISDTDNNLTWQRSESLHDWEEAKEHCDGLILAGSSDWRLPELFELDTLVDTYFEKPTINTTYFPTAKPSGYWTATQGTPSRFEGAWYVNFFRGGKNYGIIDYDRFVRCVRGRMR